jgi:carbon storage regulator
MIGDNVEITIVDVRGDKVRLGITAPREISVHRREVYDAIQREKRTIKSSTQRRTFVKFRVSSCLDNYLK